MNNLTIHRLIIVSLFCFCAVVSQGANPVRNGDFEQPVVGEGSFLLVNQGGSFTGWSIVGAVGNVGIFSTHYSEGGFTFPARAGVQWLDLTGNTNTATGVEQKVATTVGQDYVLRFSVGNIYDPTGDLGTTSTVNVLINGATVMSATNSKGMGTTALNWRGFSFPFTATRSMTRITFLNGDPATDHCNGLDAVTLTPAALPMAD